MKIILTNGDKLDTTNLNNIKLYTEEDKELVIQLTPMQTHLVEATKAMVEELIEILG